MKQFNVHEETHKLGRELALETGKTLLVVVHEALEMYQEGLKRRTTEDRLVDKVLREAPAVLEKRVRESIREIVSEEVPIAVKAAVALVYKEAATENARLARLMQEAAEEGDDLTVVAYEELYGTDEGLLGTDDQEA